MAGLKSQLARRKELSALTIGRKLISAAVLTNPNLEMKPLTSIAASSSSAADLIALQARVEVLEQMAGLKSAAENGNGVEQPPPVDLVALQARVEVLEQMAGLRSNLDMKPVASNTVLVKAVPVQKQAAKAAESTGKQLNTH